MDESNYERRDRVLLRPWLENMLETASIPGLEWFDKERMMFKVPWKHRSKKDWSLRHSSVFLEWARNTGRWSEGDPAPYFAQLKTRLRCAFNKAPDIEEMKTLHARNCEEPYKVYRFTTRKDSTKSHSRRVVTGWPLSRHPSSQRHHRRHRGSTAVRADAVDSDEMEDEGAQFSYLSSDIKPEWLHTSKLDITSLPAPAILSYAADMKAEIRPGENCLMSEITPLSSSSSGGMIPLSVEMLSDSDDDEDRRSAEKQTCHQALTSDLASAAGVDGKSKLLLLQMASEFVEAAAAASQQTSGQVTVCDSVNYHQPSVDVIGNNAEMPDAVDLTVNNDDNSEAVDLSSTQRCPVTRVLPVMIPSQSSDQLTAQKPTALAAVPTALFAVRTAPSAVPIALSAVSAAPSAVPTAAAGVLTVSGAELPTPVQMAASESEDLTVKRPAVGKGCIDDLDKTVSATSTATVAVIRDAPTVNGGGVFQLKKLKVQEKMLTARAKQLLDKEEELLSLERHLLAKQEALYWRERCLRSEQIATSAPRPAVTTTAPLPTSVVQIQAGMLERQRVTLTDRPVQLPQAVAIPLLTQQVTPKPMPVLQVVQQRQADAGRVEMKVGSSERPRVLPVVTVNSSLRRYPTPVSITTTNTMTISAGDISGPRVLPPVNVPDITSRDQLRRHTERIYLDAVGKTSSLLPSPDAADTTAVSASKSAPANDTVTPTTVTSISCDTVSASLSSQVSAAT